MKKIDTHQHLFYPEQFGYGWTADFPALQGSFSVDAYLEVAAGCEIVQSLFMEVDVDVGQHLGEARFFMDLAEKPGSGIGGVIAKCLPEAENFPNELEALRSPALKGVRRVLHTQDDALSQSARFRANVATLAEADLTFDLCVTQRQLPLARDLVRACPEVSFILDHCGVPSIADHVSTDSESWRQWQSGIRDLAAEPNVSCKFSGITAYAGPEQRTVDGMRPYLHELLEAFGSGRIVWGSDWPVCNLAEGLNAWSTITDALLAELSPQEQHSICIENARRVYKL
ncbi:MAG: amidohydrolase family protein [Opitutales bacterium]